jgi:hypothetical protein
MGSRNYLYDGNAGWETRVNEQWAKEQMAEDEYIKSDEKKYPRITGEGLALIKSWVEEKTRHDEAGPVHDTDPDNLNAWANEAEESVLNGNLAMVEMQSISTRSGLTETLTLPRHCIEWVDTD